MQLNTEQLLGFSNEANRKNDAMVGTKGGGPRRRKWKKKKGWKHWKR